MAAAALLAYLPVSSMLYTLKNDVLAIEYPVQHFISEALRNGESPAWFDTWCMGFPLHSVLTWGIYSTPAVISGVMLPSDITTFHIQFLAYVIAAGWAMYRLLIRHLLPDRNLSFLLACSYMLSGFTVASSQWLLYITGMAFIPFLLHCMISLFKTPGWRNAFFTALAYLLLLTNTHIYLTVFTTLFLLIAVLLYLIHKCMDPHTNWKEKTRLLRYTGLAGLFALLFSAAPLYFTIETVSFLERSSPLQDDSAFFRSNYFHPEGLKTLLLPLSVIRSHHFNTESSILNIYTGLLPLMLFIPALLSNFRHRNRLSWLLLGTAIFFLLASFGHLTPVREWLNLFPGLSHFRHPGVLRIFFILFFLLFTGYSLRTYSLEKLLLPGTPERKIILISLILFGLVFLAILLLHLGDSRLISMDTLAESFRLAGENKLLWWNSLIQLLFVTALIFAVLKKQRLFPALITAELVINFLICTPYFAVSSRSVKAVNDLLNYQRGFPVQEASPSDVPAELRTGNQTTWRNTNVFRKEISNRVSMPGPLILKDVDRFLSSKGILELKGKRIAFLKNHSGFRDTLVIMQQKPGRVTLKLRLETPNEIILQQASFPGWNAYHNQKKIPLVKNEFPFVSAVVPAGEGELVFRYEKNWAVYTAWAIHLLVLISLTTVLIRKVFFRSSSLSSQH